MKNNESMLRYYLFSFFRTPINSTFDHVSDLNDLQKFTEALSFTVYNSSHTEIRKIFHVMIMMTIFVSVAHVLPYYHATKLPY